jgi:hypothetical protein
MVEVPTGVLIEAEVFSGTIVTDVSNEFVETEVSRGANGVVCSIVCVVCSIVCVVNSDMLE